MKRLLFGLTTVVSTQLLASETGMRRVPPCPRQLPMLACHQPDGRGYSLYLYQSGYSARATLLNDARMVSQLSVCDADFQSDVTAGLISCHNSDPHDRWEVDFFPNASLPKLVQAKVLHNKTEAVELFCEKIVACV